MCWVIFLWKVENSGIHSSKEKKKKRQQTAKNNGDIRFNGTKHDDAEQNGIKDENTQNCTAMVWGRNAGQNQVLPYCRPRKKSAELSLEFGAPVSKENVRWELIPYSEQLWNLGLTPPVIYCQTLNHQSQKAMISSSEEFYVFCGFPKYLKGKVFNWKCVCLVG